MNKIAANKITAFLVSVWLAVVSNVACASEIEDFSKTIEIFKKSPQVQKYFDRAYGYALFPMGGKGAWIVGYARGKGQVYRGGVVTGKSTLNHFSIGFQGGGQVFSQVIFFQDQRAYDEFTQGSFEVDARAVAVAVTAGAQAQIGSAGVSSAASAGPSSSAQVGNHYSKGMAIFVQSKGGLMLDLSAGLQKFSFRPIANAAPIAAHEASGESW